MSDFSNSKVGDKVYCIVNGWGVIDEPIKQNIAFPVCVKFNEDLFESYLIDGRPHSTENANPILYHSKPEIIEQKRLVTKTVEAFICKSGHVGTTCIVAPSNDYVPCTITYQIE